MLVSDCIRHISITMRQIMTNCLCSCLIQNQILAIVWQLSTAPGISPKIMFLCFFPPQNGKFKPPLSQQAIFSLFVITNYTQSRVIINRKQTIVCKLNQRTCLSCNNMAPGGICFKCWKLFSVLSALIFFLFQSLFFLSAASVLLTLSLKLQKFRLPF